MDSELLRQRLLEASGGWRAREVRAALQRIIGDAPVIAAMLELPWLNTVECERLLGEAAGGVRMMCQQDPDSSSWTGWSGPFAVTLEKVRDAWIAKLLIDYNALLEPVQRTEIPIGPEALVVRD